MHYSFASVSILIDICIGFVNLSMCSPPRNFCNLYNVFIMLMLSFSHTTTKETTTKTFNNVNLKISLLLHYYDYYYDYSPLFFVVFFGHLL